MAIVPTSLARVSTALQTSVTTQTLTRTQQQLLDVQNQLSTGLKISTPSQDPGSASLIMQLQKTLESRQAYLDNISSASDQLSYVDTTIGNVTDLLQQAQSIASANVGSDVTQDARNGAAQAVQALYSQMLTLGNQQFNGAYLFGGDAGGTAPFVEAMGGVRFDGTNAQLSNVFDNSSAMSFTVAANDVFGPVTAAVAGTAALTPALANATRLSDLAGATGNGVRPGAIVLSDGTTTKTIDLTDADTIGDVLTRINNAGVGSITASINSAGDGIDLSSGSGTDDITVADAGSGTTAADLGIRLITGAGPGVPLSGSPVNPRLSPLTPLSTISGGALDLGSGITITNGTASATLSFSSDTTVQDLLNRINNAGLGVRAQINPAGTGIDVVNLTSGAGLSIGENGGTTAADLGLRTFSPSTPLASLNGGKGVFLSSTGADLRITQSDGTPLDVDLSGATTVGDVIAAINTASAGSGGTLTASLATTGNGIVLTDTAGGPGATTVTSLNGSTAAGDLGLTGTSVGGVVTGTDVNATHTSGVFADLAALRDALQRGDQAAITAAGAALKADYDHAVQTRGMAGARVQDLAARQTRLQDQNTATKSALSNLQDVDYTEAITRFQTLQTALQAALQSAGKTMNLSLMDFLS